MSGDEEEHKLATLCFGDGATVLSQMWDKLDQYIANFANTHEACFNSRGKPCSQVIRANFVFMAPKCVESLPQTFLNHAILKHNKYKK
jgi:hypothetical protein